MLGLKYGVGVPHYSAKAASLKIFDFSGGSLPADLTFSRASTATYINAVGQLASAAADQPRFTCDPVTLAAQGLLIEDASTNALVNSDDFTNASWSKYQATATANTAMSPDGTSKADTLTDTSVSDQHIVSRSGLGTLAAPYTFSVYLKAGTNSWVRLNVDNGSSYVYAHFNLSSGTTGASGTSGSGLTLIGAAITAAGNGWYRCSLTLQSPSGNVAAAICLQTANWQFGYAGTGTGTILAFGAQFEQMPWATSYIPTAGSAASRARDTAAVTLGAWFNASEGTLLSEGICRQLPPVTGWNCPWASLSNGTASEEILHKVGESGGANQSVITTAGSVQMSQSLGAYSANTTLRVATAYRLNDSNAAKGGTAGTTDTACALPPLSQLLIGGSQAGTANTRLNGTIRKITLYPVRLSNTELQTVTA